MMRFAINGFGRVGRTLLRVYHTRPDARAKLELSAINEIADADTVVHLARYDSNYGRYPGRIARSDNLLAIDQYLVPLSHEAEVSALPWGSLGIDMVFECTGAFTDRATAEQHLHAGADRVLFSHPAESDVDATVVYGVNDEALCRDMRVVSAASCTTNAVVPVLDTLVKAFGIEAATITTIHSLMNDQPVLDAYHHTDLRKTRAASQSIIPVDTGLAVGIERILPSLAGKLSAHALRVPTTKVSAIELTVATEQICSSEQINAALRAAAESSLAGVLDYSLEPLASCDFAGEAASAIVDAKQTQVAAGKLAKILIWFDNEWAYASRMIDVALAWERQINQSLPTSKEQIQ
ncbi:MAG: glyceraldehyde 3-phosphate dehydrogenase NAD-binding domain-containing protein [Halieaceae bacterium]|jgi:D-erythrose 4-phosphate dehydrogenase